jgi:hypothetical protein
MAPTTAGQQGRGRPQGYEPGSGPAGAGGDRLRGALVHRGVEGPQAVGTVRPRQRVQVSVGRPDVHLPHVVGVVVHLPPAVVRRGAGPPTVLIQAGAVVPAPPQPDARLGDRMPTRGQQLGEVPGPQR